MITELFEKEKSMESIYENVHSVVFGLELVGGDKKHKSSHQLLMSNVKSSMINLIQFTMDEVMTTLLETTSLLDYANGYMEGKMELITSISIKYHGAVNDGYLETRIPLEQIIQLCSTNAHSGRDELNYNPSLEPMVLNGCLNNAFKEFLSNFHDVYGIYIPKVHLTPLESTCVSCGMSFDGGSILENFIQQGKDGVEYYQRHPQDILVDSVESCYGEPYRFGKIIHVKVQGTQSSWYECPKCKTKQSYINK